MCVEKERDRIQTDRGKTLQLSVFFMEGELLRLIEIGASCFHHEPLRDVVYEQYESLSGMVFLENGPEFRDTWPVGRLLKLKQQIEEYGLAKVLELSVDPEHLDQVPDGEPVIIAYPDLARQFNFI